MPFVVITVVVVVSEKKRINQAMSGCQAGICHPACLCMYGLLNNIGKCIHNTAPRSPPLEQQTRKYPLPELVLFRGGGDRGMRKKLLLENWFETECLEWRFRTFLMWFICVCVLYFVWSYFNGSRCLTAWVAGHNHISGFHQCNCYKINDQKQHQWMG